MPRFKPGQEVTPNRKHDWEVVFGDFASKNFPKYGKVYTVIDNPIPAPWDFMVRFVELGDKFVFNENGFDPLITDKELIEGLWEQEDIKHDRHIIDG